MESTISDGSAVNTQEGWTISQYVQAAQLAERIVELSHLIKGATGIGGGAVLNTICEFGEIFERGAKLDDLRFLTKIKDDFEKLAELEKISRILFEERKSQKVLWDKLMELREEIRKNPI